MNAIDERRQVGPARFQQREQTGDDRSIVRALGAVVALLLIVLGVPGLVLWLNGVPSLPTSWPTREDLTGAIGTEQLVTVLVLIAFVAWLQFTICVVVELRSALSGVGLPTRVPLSGPSQRFARILVGSVIVATTAVGPAAATSVAEPVGDRAAVSVAMAVDDVGSATGYGDVHVSVDSSSAAEQEAGSGDLTYYLGDEVIGDSDAERLAGHKVYRVQPPEGRYHDNLWDIAERHLGDGRRYKEIFELNRGRTQPDGHELSLARLIYPQWLLIMPDDATGLDRVTAVEERAPEPETAVAAPETAPAADAVDASYAAGTAADAGSGHVQPVFEPSLPDASGRPAQDLVTGALLAAGLLAAIESVRRRRRTPEPDDDAVETEVALRIGADPDRAGWLDQALRQLAAACRAQGRRLPAVYAAVVDNDSVELRLAPASAEAPEPWEAVDDGRHWRLERANAMIAGSHRGHSAEGADDQGIAPAPFPGLVSLGRDQDGRDVLIDLEAAGGPIAVTGDPVAAYEVVTAMAAELATNRWSDQLRVTGVGLPGELTAVHESRYRHADELTGVLPDLQARHADAIGGDVLTGRASATYAGEWMPEYLALGSVPDAGLAGALQALTAGARRSPLGVVCAGDLPGARWRFDVDAAGNLAVSVLELNVAANRLSQAGAASVATLIVPERGDTGYPVLHEAWLPEVRPDVPPPARTVEYSELATAPVRVFVLGPPEAQAHGPIDSERVTLATEIVVYLALHREGVHPTVLAGAIWPGGVTAPVREAMLDRVREWLGVDPEGSPYVRTTPDGLLYLSDDVVLDWDVVCTLLARSREVGGDAERDLLRRALRVARGPVLSERPRGRYAWIARARLERAASDLLVDTAHRLSVLSVTAGDDKVAAAAARAGLRVRPSEQLLWRDLLQVEHATSGRQGVLAVTEELTSELGGLGIAELEPETMALLEELLPDNRSRVGGVG